MQSKTLIFLNVLFFLAFANTASADILINEFSSATSNDDWIELYNNGAENVNLADFRIRDTSNTNKLDLDGEIAPDGFRIFDWSNKLNNDGDIIKLVLISDENQIIDQIGYGDEGDLEAPAGTQTAGRRTDGGSEWVLFETGTKEQSNEGSSVVPTPTPTPTPTTKPTSTPKPTKAPTLSNSSPSSTQTQYLSPAPSSAKTTRTATIDPDKVPSPILGASKSAKNNSSKSADAKVLVESASRNNFRYVALGIGILSTACAILFFLKIRKKQMI